MTKAPLGGKKTGKNPTDRGKLGVKRSVVTDARGVPIGIAIAGAERARHHSVACYVAVDARAASQVDRTVQATSLLGQRILCRVHGVLARRLRYILHVPRKSEVQAKRRSGQRARRWVVEGCHSWTNRGRRLLVRWEKKAGGTYLAFIHLQFAYIALKHAGVLGYALLVAMGYRTPVN